MLTISPINKYLLAIMSLTSVSIETYAAPIRDICLEIHDAIVCAEETFHFACLMFTLQLNVTYNLSLSHYLHSNTKSNYYWSYFLHLFFFFSKQINSV